MTKEKRWDELFENVKVVKMDEINGTNEPPYRMNIKQTAKGEKYFDITIRGNDIETMKDNYNRIEAFAISQGCKKETL